MIKKKYQKDIKIWEAIDQRLIKVNLESFRYRLNLIGIYAPNEIDNPEMIDKFYSKLDEVISECGNTREVILMGDLNARVGRGIEDPVVGQYGETTRNNNGKKLIQLCQQFKLKNNNGFYKHIDINKYIWEDITRGRRSIIDYIITRQETKINIMDVRVQRGPECGSNHLLVRSKMVLPPKGRRKQEDKEKGRQEERRYNLQGLIQPSI
ncbi:Craniofacial development protein 2 [Zootermopsis nevadensis]|uniref:Craniofacial development protein 2 n=1 Tax=Zootermopsis nevadensis TaxID=136037 RepID=A0A067RIJ7_ZOONE|nr:Craniofacial development protein 2 [Zootermopsis nevadensis]